MTKSSTVFVGMDVHKESIEVALTQTTGEARHYGRIGGEAVAVARLVRKLRSVHRERPNGGGVYVRRWPARPGCGTTTAVYLPSTPPPHVLPASVRAAIRHKKPAAAGTASSVKANA